MEVKQDLELAIKKMILTQCRVKGVRPEEIPTSDPVIGSQGVVQLDSLDAVEIVTALERTFGLKADAMPLKNIFRSYKELTEYISKQVSDEKIQQFIKDNSF